MRKNDSSNIHLQLRHFNSDGSKEENVIYLD